MAINAGESFTFGDQRRAEDDDRLTRPERSRINPALIIRLRSPGLFAPDRRTTFIGSSRLRKNAFTTHRSTRDAGNDDVLCLLPSCWCRRTQLSQIVHSLAFRHWRPQLTRRVPSALYVAGLRPTTRRIHMHISLSVHALRFSRI